MTKSIQWKLVIMFVLLIISVMIVVGTYLLNSITQFYHEQFLREMDKVFYDKAIKEDFQPSAVQVQTLEQKLQSLAVQLGLDSYRNYYILNGVGGIIASSRSIDKNIEISPNIIKAMAGEVGRKLTAKEEHMDYAVPIYFENSNDQVKYIIYIKDTKEELKWMTSDINYIVLSAVFFGLIISMGLGFFLSDTITQPIAILTQKAEKIAAGDFEQIIEVKSKDEIGKLTKAFNYMASTLKHNLEEIAAEKHKMEAIFVHMTDGIMAFNLQGRIIHINPAAKKMLGLEEQEIYFDQYFKQQNVSISMGDLIYLEHTNALEKQLDVNGMHLKAFFVTFKIDSDKPGGIIVVLQDITEQQKLEMVRREFVANVSHELKTPLTSIKSYTETLLEGALEDTEIAEQFLKVVNSEADRMTRLVKDLLVLSHLDSQKTEWKKSFFGLTTLIEEAVEKLSLSAKQNNHLLTFTLTTEVPQIYGDKDKIEQVILNIISNAIKYTPKGGEVSVFAGCLYNEVYVKVKDNGLGIPRDDLPRIFERFYRVDKARSRELGGTGLGLAIAQEIVTAHQGTITIQSQPGQGTEVIIKLPVTHES